MKLFNANAAAEELVAHSAPLIFLALFGAWSFFLGGVCCLFFDKYLAEHQAWITLAKFGASLCTYAVTMQWMMTYMRCDEVVKRRSAIAATIGASAVLSILFVHAFLLSAIPNMQEQASICTVLARMAIIPPTAFIAIAFKVILSDSNSPTVLRRGLLWATGLAILGCAPAILMLLPETIHTSAMHVLSTKHAHEALKSAHFLGLHALQIMPIGCWLVSMRGASFHRQIDVIDACGSMIALTLFILVFKAILNEAIFSPGILTSMMVAIVALTVCKIMMVFFGSPIPKKT